MLLVVCVLTSSGYYSGAPYISLPKRGGGALLSVSAF